MKLKAFYKKSILIHSIDNILIHVFIEISGYWDIEISGTTVGLYEKYVIYIGDK